MKPDFITKVRLHAWMCLFLLLPLTAAGQQLTITGTVVDEFGETLPGVTVVVDGTTRGVSTDIDGKYTINAFPGEVLVFSYVGMNVRRITVGTQTVINVTLLETTSEIESVVVVGYGVQKKETVVGAVSQISGERLKDVKMGGAIENSLQGVLPGMVVLMQDATPGEESKSITMQIRAGASMGNNSPLILVDGVERSFSNLDPEEISSISVLKDASATAVYGVKGANGVVIVNTKRGSEGALQLDFTAETSLKMATRLPEYMNSYETMLLRNEAYKNDGKWSSLISDEALEHYRTGDSPWLYPNFDWMDFYFKPAFDQNYNINARGGNAFVNYFVSLGYLNESDIYDVGSLFPYTFEKKDASYWHNRYNFRNNLDFNLTRSTKLTINLAGNIKVWNKPVDDYTQEQWYESVTALPYYPKETLDAFPDDRIPYDQDGIRYYENPQQGEVRMMWVGGMGFRRNKSNGVSTDVNLEQKLDFITEGLKASAFYSFNADNNYMKEYPLSYLFGYYLNPADTTWYRYTNWQVLDYDTPQPKLITSRNERLQSAGRSVYYKGQIDYARSFGRHNVTAVGVFSRRQYRGISSFPSYEENWVARATYNYNEKYLFESSVAYTGSEKFAPGLRFGTFPSFALGWVASEEDFWKNAMPWFNYFKSRFSWGMVGSDAGIARWLYISEYTNGSDYAGFGYPMTWYPSIQEGTIPVTDATWETAVKANLGFEMGFFQNSVTLNVDLYDEHRNDILQVRRSVPSWVGVSSISGNSGETKAHGVEIELGYNHSFNRDFTLQLRGIMSANESRVVSYDEPDAKPQNVSVEGKPVGVAQRMSGYTPLSAIQDGGFYQDFDELFMWPLASGPSPIVGDFKYIDYNGDGFVNDLDRIVPRNPYVPAFTWGANLAAIYKNLTLRVDFYGVGSTTYAMRQGGMFYLYPFTQNKDNAMTAQANHWTPDNRNAEWPAVHSMATAQYNYLGNEFSIVDGRYTRLKNVAISYRLEKEPLQKVGIRQIDLTLTGTNLATWTPFKLGGDPEGFNSGVDFGAYPMMKRFTVEARMTF